MGVKTVVLLFSLAVVIQARTLKYDFVIKSPDDGKLQALDDEWWKTAVIYQIYPLSFMDSNGDGVGDLQGIISRLDHLTDMGITAAWLSPIYKSPGVDQGYDISDYRDIDPVFGTLADLKELLAKAHDLGLKIFMDLVPSYTSDQIDWFQQSLKRNGTYTDYYVWVDGEEGTPPNNWNSVFDGSAWEWSEERQQYYYHSFTPQQPDLNYYHPDVVREMKDIMVFWLDFGVDGFRVDAVPQLFEDPELRDEPPSGKEGVYPYQYDFLRHLYTIHQEPTFDMVYQFRAVLDKYNENVNQSRIMMTECYVDYAEQSVRYYGNSTTNGAQFSFNFNFITSLGSDFKVDNIITIVDMWLSHLGTKYTSNWVLGNHDQFRVATRLGVENADAFNMLTAFLPGVQITYMGEEIGMENGEVTCEQGKDPRATKNCTTYYWFSRDFERTPYQWDNTTTAGFSSTTETWLPVSENRLKTNLRDQNVPDIKSHYNVYKDMVKFRENFKSITSDTLSLIKLSDNVLQIVRRTNKGEFIYLFNAGDSSETVNFYSNEVDFTAAVVSVNSQHVVGEPISNPVTLLPHESVVLNGVVNN